MFKKKIVIWIYFSHFLSMFWFKCPGSKWRVRNGPGSICLGSKCQGSKRVDPGSVLWYLMICLHCFMLHLPVCAILGFTVSITQCFHDIYIYIISKLKYQTQGKTPALNYMHHLFRKLLLHVKPTSNRECAPLI